jgi:hypothetical protein
MKRSTNVRMADSQHPGPKPHGSYVALAVDVIDMAVKKWQGFTLDGAGMPSHPQRNMFVTQQRWRSAAHA